MSDIPRADIPRSPDPTTMVTGWLTVDRSGSTLGVEVEPLGGAETRPARMPSTTFVTPQERQLDNDGSHAVIGRHPSVVPGEMEDSLGVPRPTFRVPPQPWYQHLNPTG